MAITNTLIFVLLFVAQGFLTALFLKAENPKACGKSLLVKQICATVFVITGIIAMFIADNHTQYANLMMIGLAVSWIGDFLLHVKSGNETLFALGLLAFLIAHIFYISSYTKATMALFPELPFMGVGEVIAYVLVTSVVLFTVDLGGVKFGKAYLPCLLYMGTIGVMVVKAFSLAIHIFISGSAQLENPVLVGILLIIGSLLFLSSDYTLSFLCFKKDVKKHGPLRYFNMYTYFFGQMFLGLTILYLKG